MLIKKIFILSALFTVIMTDVFGICTIQHAYVHDHVMRDGTMLSDNQENGTCPLGKIAYLNFTDKSNQADFWSLGRNVAPTGMQHLASSSVIAQIETQPSLESFVSGSGQRARGRPVTITSPSLAWAFSRGILHPKKDPSV